MTETKSRVPPNQRVTAQFPVLHYGEAPKVDLTTWDFRVEGLVQNPVRLSYDEFLKLQKTVSMSDFHCVTGWSRMDNKWEGVMFKTVCDLVKPRNEAKYVTIISDDEYTTSLPLAELLDPDVILAYKWDDKALSVEHGGPLRLVVPEKYAYKSAKWVRKLRFTEKQEMGFWATRGYSNTADPWKEKRYT